MTATDTPTPSAARELLRQIESALMCDDHRAAELRTRAMVACRPFLAAYAEQADTIATLRSIIDADEKRLRDAEARVWTGNTFGCDAPDNMAEEILTMRRELAERDIREEQLAVHLAEARRVGIELSRKLRLAEAECREFGTIIAVVETALARLVESVERGADVPAWLSNSNTVLEHRRMDMEQRRAAARDAGSVPEIPENST